MKRILAILLGLAPLACFAATYTASVTGAWNNTATWGGSGPPTSADAVLVHGGITVTIPSGYTANCTTIQCPNTAGTGTIINNGTLATTSGNSVKIGNGTGQEGIFTFGPNSITTITSSKLYLQNGQLNSTSSAGNWAVWNGTTGGIDTTGVTGPAQNINLSYVSFQNADNIKFYCEATTGAQTNGITINHCVFYACKSMTFGATDTANTVPISITNCDFVSMPSSNTITIQQVTGGTTALFQHNTVQVPNGSAYNTAIIPAAALNLGLTIDSCALINATILSNTGVGGLTITNNLQTQVTAQGYVTRLADNAAGSLYDHNYIAGSSADGGDNLHALQTQFGVTNASGTQTFSNNLMDCYVDSSNQGDMIMHGNSTAVNQSLCYGNIAILSADMLNGAHSPAFTTGTGVLLRNNTIAGTISSATINSGVMYRPEGPANTGTIAIRGNLHYGNAASGDISIEGAQTSGGAQTVAESDYNNIYNVTTPYANNTQGLTITAGNTTKTIPNAGAGETNNDPKFFGVFFGTTRNGALWNSIFGSGTNTTDAMIAYFTGLNGYRGTPNFDQGGTPCAYSVRNMLDWVAYGYSPTNLALRGAGAPADGSPDQGAMNVRTIPGYF